LIFAVAILADRLECVEDGIKFSKQDWECDGRPPVRSVSKIHPGQEEGDAGKGNRLRSRVGGCRAGLAARCW